MRIFFMVAEYMMHVRLFVRKDMRDWVKYKLSMHCMIVCVNHVYTERSVKLFGRIMFKVSSSTWWLFVRIMYTDVKDWFICDNFSYTPMYCLKGWKQVGCWPWTWDILTLYKVAANLGRFKDKNHINYVCI